eukprot:jgi/Galph1/4833/GphlegSOOS_G3416.1
METDIAPVLIDLCSRFLLTLSQEDFDNFERLFFAEEAHWFYEDFFREKNMNLPKLSLKEFAVKLFEQFPLLENYAQKVEDLLKSFQKYKNSVPTAGVAILNESLDKVLLVRSFKGKTWSFPKGKVEKNESFESCAVREAFEEIGFDVSSKVSGEDVLTSDWGGHKSFIFIVPDISEATSFETNTRREISEIRWHPIFELPTLEGHSGLLESSVSSKRNRFFTVLPFVKPLQSWILKKRKNSVKIFKTPISSNKTHSNNSNLSTSGSKFVHKKGYSEENDAKLREQLYHRRQLRQKGNSKKDLETFGIVNPFHSEEEERKFFKQCLERKNHIDTVANLYSLRDNSISSKSLETFSFARSVIASEMDRVFGTS